MADTSNLSKFLSDVADAIRTKKETIDTIPAKDFDTEILSIETGIDTSDATATADNIENGYTAYVNGKKISGNVTTSLDTIITAGSDATITDTGEALTVDRGYGEKIILKSEQQLRSTIPYTTIASMGGVTSDKIIKGETVFGVEGTAEGGGGIDTSDATATSDDIINPKTAYVKGEKIEGAITSEGRVLDGNMSFLQLTENTSYYIYDICERHKLVVLSNAPITASTTFYVGKYDDAGNIEIVCTKSFTGTTTYKKINDMKFSKVDNANGYVNIFIDANGGWNGSTYWQLIAQFDPKTNTIVHFDEFSRSRTGGDQSCVSIVPHPKEDGTYILCCNRSVNAPDGLMLVKYNAIGHTCSEYSYFSNVGSSGRSYGSGYWNQSGTKFIWLSGYCYKSTSYSIYSYALNGTSLTRVKSSTSKTASINLCWLTDDLLLYGSDIINIGGNIIATIPNLNYNVNGTSMNLNNDGAIVICNNNSMILTTIDINTNVVVQKKNGGAYANWYTGDNYKNGMLLYKPSVCGDNVWNWIDNKLVKTYLDGEYVITSFTRKGIKYQNTIDGICNANEILSGKIAYNSEGKITGAMPNNGELNYTPSTEEQTIPAGYTSGGTVSAVDSSIDSNIAAENIKKDVSILGVTGTFEGSGGGTVEGIKQFSTIEEMQADATAKEGDLAVVYGSSIQNATVDSKFQVATFPETVVLDTAMTDYVDIRYRAVDDNTMFDCMGQLDSSMFMMECYTESGSVRIQYESSDGITYTRTDTTGNPVDFGTEIYYAYTEMWNDAIGKFIQIGGSSFEGLYNFSNVNTDTLLFKTKKLDLSNTKNIAMTYNIPEEVTTIGGDWYIYALISTTTSGGITNYVEYETPLNYTMVYEAYTSGGIVSFHDIILDDNGYHLYGTQPKTFTESSYTNPKAIIQSYENGELVNTKTYTATEIKDMSTAVTAIGSNNWYKAIVDIPEISALDLQNMYYICRQYHHNYGNWSDTIYMQRLYVYDGVLPTESLPTSLTTTFETLVTTPVKGYKYIIAPTQLTATSDDVYIQTFYGKDGVEIGTLQNKENLTIKQVQKKVTVWNNFNEGIICPSNMISAFTNYTNLKTMPLLDTSNVTIMESMFTNCESLTTIPLIDTSNVKIMTNMFWNCTSLTSIPLLDTSNVTEMGGMFYCCTSLATLPQLNTSNNKSMDSMFYQCWKLTNIPLLDTGSVTSMYYAFYDCKLLATLPILNTGKVTNMNNTFKNCTSLSDESLNNILQMCINATSYTGTKTLKYIGLTSAQATKCTTLSNYSAFTAAGWTTGY